MAHPPREHLRVFQVTCDNCKASNGSGWAAAPSPPPGERKGLLKAELSGARLICLILTLSREEGAESNSLTMRAQVWRKKGRNTDSGGGGDSWQSTGSLSPVHPSPRAQTKSLSVTTVYSCQMIPAPSRNDGTSTKQRRFESSELITQRFQKVHVTEPQCILQLTWRERTETSNISPIGWQPSKHSSGITMILRTMETF